MAHFCNGIHDRYLAPVNERKYEFSKRCTICEVFIKKQEGILCPCCHTKMRSKIRSKKPSQKIQYKRI